MFVKNRSFSPTPTIIEKEKPTVQRDNYNFDNLFNLQVVVATWKAQAESGHPFTWKAIEEVCTLYFEEYSLDLKRHFRLKSSPNSTAIATLLEEKALELTLELPSKLTNAVPPSGTEVERWAFTIKLMQMVAIVARALHNKPSAKVKF